MIRTDLHLPARAHRRGFTLTEMMIAVPSIAILMLGMAAAIKTAGRAVPDGTSISSTAVATGRVMDLLAADITYAVAIDKMTATELIFTVADRDVNGLAETIRYAWSGAAGAPLTRQIKTDTAPPITWSSVPATSIAGGVQEFAFEYDKRSASAPTTYSSGTEILLASADGTSSLDTYTVTGGNGIGQFLVPALPANARSWKITRATVRMRSDGILAGQAMAQICTAKNGLPTSAILDQTPIQGSLLPTTYGPRNITFSNLPNLPPSTGVCLCITWTSGLAACDVQYSNSDSPLSHLVITSNGGAVWTATENESSRFNVYGTIETPDPPVLRYALANVRCQLRTGADPATRISTYIRVLNEPQVSGP